MCIRDSINAEYGETLPDNMPMQYGSNGRNSDGSCMNVGNQIWDPKAGGRPSIRLYPEHRSGQAVKNLLTDEAMGFEDPEPDTSFDHSPTSFQTSPAQPSATRRSSPSRHQQAVAEAHQRHGGMSSFELDIRRLRGEQASVMLRHFFNSCDGGLKAAFELCDANGDKALDAHEVQQLLKHLGCELAYEEAAELVALYDLNGDGLLEYFEVVRMLSHDGLPVQAQMIDPARFEQPGSGRASPASVSPYSSPRSNATPKAKQLNARQRMLLREVNAIVYQQMHSLLEAFKKMDHDGDKYVTVREFIHLVSKYDLEISQEECWGLFRLVTEGEALNYSAFVKLLAVGNQ
eukprot:TRINITY_DN18444_c0_g1_i1.p1 TRINITY_DN18444_c0_g1~~TRINITY_DN18444_c0_g1_i1.p1  ORF type:complete len:346 (-),score=85.67 TRINITY_DN18444_c0_g1_i1:61-1098(-)